MNYIDLVTVVISTGFSVVVAQVERREMSGVSLDIPVVLFVPSRPVHYLNVVPPGRSSNPQL